MKSCIKSASLVSLLLAGLCGGLASKVSAQTFTTLHHFIARSGNPAGFQTNSEGAYPNAGLVLLGQTLYGTAISGGAYGNGTLFAINTDGTGFTNIHDFTSLSN